MSEEGKTTICNLTGRRIGITTLENQWFVLPPFGRRALQTDELERLDYQPWERLNLIKIIRQEKKETAEDKSSIALGLAFGLIFWIIIIALPLRFLLYPDAPHFWRDLGILIIIIFGLFLLWNVWKKSNIGWGDIKQKISIGLKTIKHLIEILLSLSLILAVGFGLPALVIYLGMRGREFIAIDLLAHGLQWIFIATASLLPALMYFLFTNQKLGTLRENIFRDIVQIDPRVITLDDAKSLYENRINAIYGTGGIGRLLEEVRSPIFVATVVITVGWILTLDPWEAIKQGSVHSIFKPHENAIVFGFLGAYFFGLNMLFRRYARVDLRPKAYSHFTIRIFVVIILVWVLSEIPWLNSTNSVLFPLAFVIGIVPETAFVVIREYLLTFKWFKANMFRIKAETSLEELEGINIYHRAQLLEEGIENIENLAHHDLIDLMLQTRIPLPRLVDWVDQAILHLHIEATDAGSQMSEKKELWKTMRDYGIRTASDLKCAYEVAECRGQGNELMSKLEGKTYSPDSKEIKRFQVILDTFEDDEWMAHICHYRDTIHMTNKIFKFDDFSNELQSELSKEERCKLKKIVS